MLGGIMMFGFVKTPVKQNGWTYMATKLIFKSNLNKTQKPGRGAPLHRIDPLRAIHQKTLKEVI